VGKGRVLYLLPHFQDLFLYLVDSDELELDALLIIEPEPSDGNHDKKKNYSEGKGRAMAACFTLEFLEAWLSLLFSFERIFLVPFDS
jgi:hypothetical protein